jgi:hypothetical protein
VLFKQLFETHPRIIEDSEAAYTVAMLQEMFYQIDYNGDGTCMCVYVYGVWGTVATVACNGLVPV